MTISKKTKCLAILCVLWMGVIFLFSAQTVDSSIRSSNHIIRLILEILEPEQYPVNSTAKTESDSDSVPASTTSSSASSASPTSPTKDEAAASQTERQKEPALHPTKKWFGIPPHAFNMVIRKAAHLSLFFVLGLLVSMTLFSAYNRLEYFLPLIAWGVCIVYATLDEFHQLFVEGRGAQLSDVAIDSGGALLGVLIVTICCLIRQKRRSHGKK